MTDANNTPPAGIGDIVVGIDDSPSSLAALDWAAKVCSLVGRPAASRARPQCRQPAHP